MLAYDPLGRLLYSNADGGRYFEYDGTQLIREIAPGGATSRRYVHGPGVDEPLLWYEGSGTADRRFLVADERGSIVAVTDGAGNAIAINSYDEYGIPEGSAAGVPGTPNLGRFQYSERPRPARGGWPTRASQAWLPGIGLYYYKPVLSYVEGARMYSPTLGAPCRTRALHARAAALMQTDPIGYGDGMNLYAYVGGDPVNYVDPTGLMEEENDGGEKPADEIVVTGRRVGNSGSGGGSKSLCRGCFRQDFDPGKILSLPEPQNSITESENDVACPVARPAVITARFGVRRGSSTHNGVDLRARMGAAIFAPFSGRVRSIFSSVRGGDSILIDNADGSVSGFSHTGAVPNLRVGASVTPGQQIGISNGTGTGAPHLHLTYRATPSSPTSDPLATAIGAACNATHK